MDRLTFLICLPGAWLSLRAHAHHGWTSFDESKPLYFEGEVVAARWQNPHAEIDLRIEGGLRLPADLTTRSVPAQQAAVDAARILADAQPPPRSGVWTCELAPLTRLAAWQVPQPDVGDRCAVVGFTRQGAPDLRMRAEFVLIGEQVYPLRSVPA
jgi:hypothetical protein